MGAMDEGVCRRCLGGGVTNYHGTIILCPTCYGCGLRRPEFYAPVIIDGVRVGILNARNNDDDASLDWYVEPAEGATVPPQRWEVDIATREEAQRGNMED